MKDPKQDMIDSLKQLEELRERRKKKHLPPLRGLSKEISRLHWYLKHCYKVY